MTHGTPADDCDQLLQTASVPERVRRRHAVVTVLRERDATMTLDELVGALAAGGGDADAAEASAGTDTEDRAAGPDTEEGSTDGDVHASTDGDEAGVRIQLYHNHLPRLADAGLVEFDPEQRTVTPAE